ncbi:MAG: hypothetical protein WCE90_06250 [Candidatus Zixiibacteriota bacterium]
MKSIMKPVGLVILWSVLVLFGGKPAFAQGNHQASPPGLAQSQDAVAQESYVLEVVVKAPWGEKNLYQDAGGEESKPGEFGHYSSVETELAPTHFTVAPNGDIYISDPLNKRIQKFGPNGQFISIIPLIGGEMCVDQDNNIYLFTAQSAIPKDKWFINKYDQSGNLLQSYPVQMEGREMWSIHCDNSGRVFMQFFQDVKEGDNYTALFGFCQVGASARVFSPEEQKSSFREGSLGYNSVSAGNKLYFKAGRLVTLSGDTTRTFKPIQGWFFGCDENLNIYTLRTPDEPRKYILREYDRKGELMGLWNLSPPRIRCHRKTHIFR